MGEKVKRPNGNKTKFNETLQCSSPTGTYVFMLNDNIHIFIVTEF